MDMIWIGVLIVAIIVALRLLAKAPGIIGKIFKGWWNISFKLCAMIPGLGWMTHFIIADDAASREEKERLKRQGKKSDDFLVDSVNAAASRQQAEEEARQARYAAEQRALQEQEEDLRRMAYRKYGTRDVQLNSDGSKARINGSDWISSDELERELRR